jgi:hypothetical protein
MMWSETELGGKVSAVSLVIAWNPTLSARSPASRGQTFALGLSERMLLDEIDHLVGFGKCQTRDRICSTVIDRHPAGRWIA